MKQETTTQQTPSFEIKIGGSQNGTYLNGYMTANYKDIVKLLGKPTETDGYKCDANWVITINGKTITIYNYKDGKNYLGAEGTPKTKITDWHIGGSGNITAEANWLASQLNTTFRSSY